VPRRSWSHARSTRHGDCNVVELRATIDLFKAKDQLRCGRVRRDGRLEFDALPAKRAEDVILLRPGFTTGRGDVQHELDAIPGLRGLAHPVGFHQRTAVQAGAAQLFNG
jgi:hypothetical protein